MQTRHAAIRGLSLLEVVIASTLMVILSGMTMAGLIFYLRESNTLLMRARLAEDARQLEEEMIAASATSNSIVASNGGNTLTFTLSDGTSRVFVFVNTDNNINTVIDNSIIERIPAPGGSAADKVWANWVTPVIVAGVTQPIFQLPAGRRHIEVRMRFGDNLNTPAALCNRATGPGFQTYVLNTGLFPRNSL